jgi:hypothetical protein
MTTHDGGKGDAPRPIQNKDQFDKNWDEIFNKSKEEKCVNYEIEADNDHISILATIPFGR